jgi:ATP-binding cassette subfamily C (CFTR/MRP) protein 1
MLCHVLTQCLEPFLAFYDRILVMDSGVVAEFDTPLTLFDREDSIFRSLCNEASLTREDIVRIRASVGTPQVNAQSLT